MTNTSDTIIIRFKQNLERKKSDLSQQIKDSQSLSAISIQMYIDIAQDFITTIENMLQAFRSLESENKNLKEKINQYSQDNNESADKTKQRVKSLTYSQDITNRVENHTLNFNYEDPNLIKEKKDKLDFNYRMEPTNTKLSRKISPQSVNRSNYNFSESPCRGIRKKIQNSVKMSESCHMYDSVDLNDKNSNKNGEVRNIEKVKLTNNILRKINMTENFQSYFGNKYGKASYKAFLENLIAYKYNEEQLKEIIYDIDNLEDQPKSLNEMELPQTRSKNAKRYMKINPNTNNRESPKEANFESGLRKYDSNKNVSRKEFIRFNKPHGEYFENKNKSFNSKN